MNCIYIPLLSILLLLSCSDKDKETESIQKTLMEYVIASDIQGIKIQ